MNRINIYVYIYISICLKRFDFKEFNREIISNYKHPVLDWNIRNNPTKIKNKHGNLIFPAVFNIVLQVLINTTKWEKESRGINIRKWANPMLTCAQIYSWNTSCFALNRRWANPCTLCFPNFIFNWCPANIWENTSERLGPWGREDTVPLPLPLGLLPLLWWQLCPQHDSCAYQTGPPCFLFLWGHLVSKVL